MYYIIDTSLNLVNHVFDHTCGFFHNFVGLHDLCGFPDLMTEIMADGNGVTTALAAGAIVGSVITESIRTNIKKWHGGIDDRFDCIDNIVSQINGHQPPWTISPEMLAKLNADHQKIKDLIHKCHTVQASRADRTQRDSLLSSTVEYCLLNVKVWAHNEFTNGRMTADDVHLLGFLLPGEQGGHRERSEETDFLAEIKLSVINEDYVRIVIDNSAGENAALVTHGWPAGIKMARIVILAADGKTEVYNQITSHLHNDVKMPEGSHGKQFIAKAAFLKHIDDDARFGNEPTFSMPLTTADLVISLEQHKGEKDAQTLEIERQRLEIERQRLEMERVKAELNAKNKG
jgi:hypothetical protein